MGKKKSMKQKLQSMQDNSDQATKSKAYLNRPTEAGFHEPNRPSI
jgi:hypothetical protein